MRARTIHMQMVRYLSGLVILISLVTGARTAASQVAAEVQLPLAAGMDHSIPQSITIGGVARTYRLYVPPKFRPDDSGLIIALHGRGAGGPGLAMEQYSHLDSKADEEGFAVAYLDGLVDATGTLNWNYYYDFFFISGPDDVGFVRVVIDHLEQELRPFQACERSPKKVWKVDRGAVSTWCFSFRCCRRHPGCPAPLARKQKGENATVIAGHFGFAALVKSREKSAPLWILMLASVWLDVVFIPLFMAGIETIHPVQGRAGYGAAVICADYTHSVVGMLMLSAALAALCLPFWGSRTAIVVGFVAASHWALDLVVHRTDMFVLPGNFGNLPRLGFGLWRFPLLAASLEAALVVLGAGFYWRSARSVSIQARRGTQWAAAISVLIAICGLSILGMDLSSR